MNLILTVPWNARFQELAKIPFIEGFRVNTTRVVDRPLEDVLTGLREQAGSKDIWIDLKCRQLRVKDYSVQVFENREVHTITLSHRIHVNLHAKVYADDGNYTAEIAQVNGDKLTINGAAMNEEGIPLPSKGVVGLRPSMSINITDPSLKVEGNLTEKDIQCVKAGKALGMHKYFLSYVERPDDLEDVMKLDKEAVLGLKIESRKGIDFVRNDYAFCKKKYGDRITLIAARGDMYVEIDDLTEIPGICEMIAGKEPNAILASRIFSSLASEKFVSCADIFDMYACARMGYTRFLVGDDICSTKAVAEKAIQVFYALSTKMPINLARTDEDV